MNKPIRTMSIFCMLLFAGLVIVHFFTETFGAT